MKIIHWIRRIFGIQALHEKSQENNKILHELNWANVFNNTIANSRWLLDKGFSPGRFAVGYPFLYILYRILNDIKPENILEFGLGESSKMLLRYAEFFKDSSVSTVESNQDWIDYFAGHKPLPANVKITLVEEIPVKIQDVETLSIKDVKSLVRNNKYELILVDGPHGSARYSRSQILSLLPDNINTRHFCLIMDDYDRPGEKETCLEIENILNANGIEFNKGIYQGMKESILYCSSDLRFLTTL